MQAKAPKKSPLGNRSGSATAREAGSTSASPAADSKKRGYANIWPEWNDADVNAEKWETTHKGGKEKEKGKSPVVSHFFEDPEGRIELPHILKIDYWKRPQDFIVDMTPVVVDQNNLSGFDLLSANEAVHDSELMRYITSEIMALWKHSRMKHAHTDSTACLDPNLPFDGEYIYTWRPWEHIYAINKVTKGPTIPLYNSHGKYAVRLYWLGCWRKIIVDDTIPYNEADQMLLPATTRPHEIWPMLLTKALVKVASLDYNGGNTACEFGDFSVIHCLTSWLPEPIPLQMGHTEEIWELLRASLPEFLLPELPSTEERAMSEERNKEETPVDEKSEKEKSNLEKVEAAAKPAAAAKSGKPDKDKGKDDKKDKKGQEKEKAKEKSIVQDELPIPDHPEYMVFASYIGPLKYPIKVSALSDMANASESLRLAGFSHLYPHPVNIRQTRSCPLEPPPPPEKIPAWKLIRPRKKRVTPSDEPIAEPEPQKPIQTLEITSPFINYKVSPIPIPAETHRPRSTLTRGSTRVSSRPGTANPPSIEEGDENVQQSDSNAEMTDTQNLLMVDNLPQETKISEVETISDLDPHTEVQEKVSSGKDKLGGGEKSAGKKRTSSSKTKSEKSDKPEKPEKSDKSDKEPDRGKSPGGKKKGASNRDSADMGNAVDAADLSAALEAQLDDRGAEETGSEAKVTEPSTTMQDIWMDFSIFCKCFKTLYIYHKTQTYPHNNKHSDIKTAVEKTPEEKLQNFLFVDNLKPTDIVVSFSALSHWNDPPPPSKEDSKLNMIRRDRESRGDALANENSSVTEVASLHEITHLEQLTPGLLIAEPYSWKSLITGQPILRLRTTSIRTAVLSLPEGRHVLRFSMSSPLGCHLHICSTVNFVFGEEERVMAELTKESCRFTDNAIQVMTTLGKCITNFNDGEMFRQAWDEFYSCHCPYRKDPTASKCYHSEIFNEAFYQMLRKALIEPQLVSQEMAQAWRAFMFDCTTKNILGLHYTSSSRPTTGITSDRGSAKKGAGAKRHSANADSFCGEPQETKVDTVRNREPTAEDHVAAVKIQMFWRGYYVRNVKAARTPGTEENHHAHELLQKAWPVLEANLEQNGLFLFRNMFKLAPELLPKYSFYKDEWNKITYSDYQGNYPEQPSNTWFVVFREVFQVVEDMLCMPKLYTSVPTCMLRVVNNDTGEEIPRIFQKVAPYVYKKNTHGYTFMAEARSVDQGIPPGRWRLRLIGSLSPLPTPQHGEVNASFQTNELHDFYVPNDRNIIFRYSVKVSEDHLVSLQMATSKSDVVVRLEILDHEEVKTIATGKGHIVLPAFIFQKDLCPVTPAVNSQTGASEDETSRRSGSRMSAGKHGSVLSKVHGSASNQVVQSKKPRIGSGVHDGRGSHASTQQSVCSLEDDDERETPKPHKYIIQATVLRNSWPLSESQWVFVQGLKELEKAEIKVMSKDATNTPQPKAVPSKDTGTKGKDKTGKKAGGKADKEKDAKTSSRPASQHFDLSKPNWVLRVVSDATCAEEIEVKKDTERIDEIRAMKKAWEDAEPGRAAKAMQSRLQYLSTHLVKVQTDEEEAGKSDASKSDVTKSEEEKLGDVDNLQPGDDRASLVLDDAEPVLTLNNPNPPVSKEVLQDIDLTPFIRETMGESRLLDLEELQRQLEEKQREIQDFRLYREQVEKRRDTERVERNKLKIRQLELFEEMQATLDALRAEVNEPREALRQRLLAEEQHRQEELAAADAALRVEQERNAPSPKGKKSPKAKSAKKK